MFKRSWKKALAILALLGFVILLFAPMLAKAAVTEDDYYNAATLLGRYGIVQGDERGYRFGDDISRAELAKLLVVTIGLESQVSQFVGRKAFTDTQGNWADGYIALAKQVGLMRGYPEGDFRPRNPVSYAEVITALSRLVGLEASSEPWPATYLGPALVAGIIPSGMTAVQDLNAAAIRGDVFVLLKRTFVDVRNAGGETLLGRFHDKKPPQLEIDPLPAETAAPKLVIRGAALDAERVEVDGTPVTLDFGRFQYAVDLSMGLNVLRVQAFDIAGNKSEQLLEITRVAGAVASIEFTGPSRLTAGEAATYTVVLRNANGGQLDDLSSVEATVSGGIGTFDVASGQFTADQVGQGTITLVAGSARRSLNVTVVAGPLNSIAISPESVSLAAGEKQTFSAAGFDVMGNPVPLSGLRWSATGGTVDSTGVFTAAQGATAMSVTATAAGKSGSVTIQPPNSQVARVVITPVTGPIIANGRTNLTLTATVQDGSGATVTTYKGDLTVTSSAPGSAAPTQTSVPVVGGVATIAVRAGATPGTATIRATTTLGVSGTADIKADPQVLKSVRITATPSPSTDGSTQGTVELLALDQNENPMVSPLTQTMLVKLTIAPDTGGVFLLSGEETTDVALGPLDPADGLVRTRTQLRFNPGSGTLVITGTPRPTVFANVKVLEGSLTAGPVGRPVEVRLEAIPETIAGQERLVYATVVDANGYRVTTGLTGYNVQLRDQNGVYWTPGAGEDLVGGSGRATFRVTQTKAGTYTYTAHLIPGGHTASYTSSVVSGTVAAVRLTASPSTLPADNTSTAVLKAELVDANGNRVTSGTFPVTFRKTTNYNATQPMTSDQVVNSVGGVAEVTVRSGWLTTAAGLPERYTASVSGIGPASGTVTVTSAPAEITVQGIPYRLALTFGDNDGDGTAGDAGDFEGTAGRPFTVEARLKAQDGTDVTWENGRQVTLTVRNVVTLQETTYTATTTTGIATFVITRQEAGTMALKAESAGLLRALSEGYGGAEADAVLKPGITTAFRVVPDLTRLKTGGSYALVAVHLVDANGNLTTNVTGRPITVTLRRVNLGPEYGYFTAEDVVGGERIDSKAVVIPPGAAMSSPVKFFSNSYAGNVTLEGTAQDGGKHSVTVTTTYTGGASALRFDPVQAVTWEPVNTADTVVTGQTVAVTVLDSAGERVTDYGLGAQTVTVTAQGDARIVAVYNPTLRTWQSLDSDRGNGVGDYATTANVPVDRGQALFRTRAHTPGDKVYKASFGGTDIASVSGRFDSTTPDYLTVQVDRRTLTGGGDQVAVQARVRDMYGNTLTWVTGKIQFTLSTAAGGTLTAPSADLANGVATVYFQSALRLLADATVTVTASSGTLRKADGVTALANATDTFTVDETPELAGLSATPGTTPGVVDADDTITFTFSEALVTGVPTTGIGSTVHFDANTSTITFGGPLAGLGSIHLPSGTITNTNDYAIEAPVLAGNSLTVRIDSKITTNPDTKVSAGWNGTVSVTMNGTLRDAQGSGAFGPFTGLAPIGGF